MLGSMAAELLPPDDAGSPGHETAGVPPLLRDHAADLVVASGVAAEIAAQLAPIPTLDALADSLAREANPLDPNVRAGYAQAWATLTVRLTLAKIRRRRHRPTIARPRRRLRGRG